MVFEMTERLVGVLVVVMAFVFFWSPVLVLILSLLVFGFYAFKTIQSKRKQNSDHLRPKSRQTADDRMFGLNPNVRHIKVARRQISFQTRSADNYVSNYLTNQMNSNYFLQSDGLLSSMTSHSVPSRPQSSNDMSYSSALYRPIRESPNSQLGNIPFVRLTSGHESMAYELKPKTQTVKPVTVRIAPMPHNLSKLSLSRLSNTSPTNVSTFGTAETTKANNPSNQTKSVMEALKRKRGLRQEMESEDSFVSQVTTNKKAKRDSLNSPKIPNGMIIANKQTVKRQSVEGTALMHKRFKNNEILSSYSSLQTPQTTKFKRKLSPDLEESSEFKSKRNQLPEDESGIESIASTSTIDNRVESEVNKYLSNNLNAVPEEREVSAPKKSFGLPFHLHSMADHDRDRTKARHRLNRFLNAVKEVTSPKSDSNEVQPTAPTETVQIINTQEIGLPSEPAAAIFTNSRVETIVTTTLLNTPISSVLTTARESLSPPKPSVEQSDNCVMTSAPNSPEVSSISTPFTSSSALLTSMGSTKTISNESTFKLDAKPLENSLGIKTTSDSFVTSNHLFKGPISTSSAPVPPLNSSSLVIPQFSSLISSSASLSIPNFTQMSANNPISFTGTSGPTFPAPQPNPMFSAEAPAAAPSFFSMGSMGTAPNSRRIAQNSRLRSRQKR